MVGTAEVSILVLMDVPLQQIIDTFYFLIVLVSILVLMDVPLQPGTNRNVGRARRGFNPCFNGCTSATEKYR